MAEFIELKFDDTYGAQQAMAAVRALQEMEFAWIDDVAIVERHKSGRVSTHTTHGSVGAGAAWGGLMGLFIGLLFPPAGFLALWGAGMAGGALAGKIAKETGLDESLMTDIKNSLDKGTSALLLMGAKGDADQMAKAFEKYKPVDVLRRDIPDQTVDNLREKLQSAEAADES